MEPNTLCPCLTVEIPQKKRFCHVVWVSSKVRSEDEETKGVNYIICRPLGSHDTFSKQPPLSVDRCRSCGMEGKAPERCWFTYPLPAGGWQDPTGWAWEALTTQWKQHLSFCVSSFSKKSVSGQSSGSLAMYIHSIGGFLANSLQGCGFLCPVMRVKFEAYLGKRGWNLGNILRLQTAFISKETAKAGGKWLQSIVAWILLLLLISYRFPCASVSPAIWSTNSTSLRVVVRIE